MPYFRYTSDFEHVKGQVLDPALVNQKFDDIARFLNGNVGADNCLPGAVLAGADLLAPRSLMTIVVPVDNALGTWPAAGTVFKVSASAALTILAIGVHSATTNFDATLEVSGGSTIADLDCPTTPILYDYMIYDIAAGAVAASGVITMTVTAGTCREIVLFASISHI